MPENVAILIGVSSYENTTDLKCCRNDAAAMEELLAATQKYSAILKLVDENAQTIKNRLSEFFDANKNIEEAFFYYSGHGYVQNREFFFCPSNFTSSQPNETGLSLKRLHDLLRGSKAQTVVQVIDACYSGINLIKKDYDPLDQPAEFRNFIRIASCLEAQESLTGDPLSEFTDAYINASISKVSGAVYYQDIADRLSDEYADNSQRRPHFIFQSTGRDIFVPDAAVLNSIRSLRGWEPTAELSEESDKRVDTEEKISLVERLKSLEETFVSREDAEKFISTLKADIQASVGASDDIEALFEQEVSSGYKYFRLDEGDVEQVVRIIEGEKRFDRFVTAKSTYIKPKRGLGLAGVLRTDFDPYAEGYFEYSLELNCDLDDLLIQVHLAPKFRALPKFQLTLAIIPSIDICYIFSFVSVHRLTSWNQYEHDKDRSAWKWFKADWASGPQAIGEISVEMLHEVVRNFVKQFEKSLSESSE